jgi:hypothetical protein
MCRPKELGGRRCPQHTDPVKHAAYNARRRELYAAQKQENQKPEITFPELSFLRPFFTLESGVGLEYSKQSAEFLNTLDPDFDISNWEENYGEDVWEERFPDFGEMDERKSVEYYTEMGHYYMGQYLQDEATDGEFSDFKYEGKPLHRQYVMDAVAKVDSALARSDKPDSARMLYRGMKVPSEVPLDEVPSWLAERFPVDGVVSQPNFMSTTLNPKVASWFFAMGKDSTTSPERAVIFEIISKQGAPLGRGTSCHGLAEAEVLLPRDAKLKVVSVDEGAPFKYATTNGVAGGRRTIIRMTDVEEGIDNVQK